MAKIDITRTELVWPGKYNEDGTRKEVPRVNLPFQVIETVNESRATREAQQNKPMSLFEVYQGKEGDTFEEGWKNKLIWGDNLLVMNSLLEKFAGKIDLIYIDPPFATGADFSFITQIGDSQWLTKEHSVIEEKAYRDTWGLGINSWLVMMYDRLNIMRDLLAKNGVIYVHLDWRMNSHLRVILDEIFGADALRNEIVWCYPPKGRGPKFAFHHKHDTIYYYSKNTDDITFDRPYTELNKKQIAKFSFVDSDGRRYKEFKGKRTYLDDIPGRPVPSWWDDIGQTGQSRTELVGYPTQKPESLLRRIITASSIPEGLVADFFCGSGTTLSVAEQLGRRWIGCDLGRWGIHITRKRLLGIDNCKPFEVLNLGKYERQYWQSLTFGDNNDIVINEPMFYKYLTFVLKLYGAQLLPSMRHCHGKKGKALVYVGAVDSPVTIDEIDQAIKECVSLEQVDLHVLGWEWEMGLAGPNNDVRRGGGGA